MEIINSKVAILGGKAVASSSQLLDVNQVFQGNLKHWIKTKWLSGKDVALPADNSTPSSSTWLDVKSGQIYSQYTMGSGNVVYKSSDKSVLFATTRSLDIKGATANATDSVTSITFGFRIKINVLAADNWFFFCSGPAGAGRYVLRETSAKKITVYFAPVNSGTLYSQTVDGGNDGSYQTIIISFDYTAKTLRMLVNGLFSSFAIATLTASAGGGDILINNQSIPTNCNVKEFFLATNQVPTDQQLIKLHNYLSLD